MELQTAKISSDEFQISFQITKDIKIVALPNVRYMGVCMAYYIYQGMNPVVIDEKIVQFKSFENALEYINKRMVKQNVSK